MGSYSQKGVSDFFSSYKQAMRCAEKMDLGSDDDLNVFQIHLFGVKHMSNFTLKLFCRF